MESYQDAPLDMSVFRMTFIICGTMPMILFLLTFVLWFMDSGMSESPTSMPLGMVVIFAVIAAAGLLLAPWVRRLGMRQALPAQMPDGTPIDKSMAAAMQIQTSCVTAMAMPEIAALMGFVLAFQANVNWLYFAPFAGAAVIGWALMFPRPAQLRAWHARKMGYEPVPSIIH